jgi:hypothetical protein
VVLALFPVVVAVVAGRLADDLLGAGVTVVVGICVHDEGGADDRAHAYRSAAFVSVPFRPVPFRRLPDLSPLSTSARPHNEPWTHPSSRPSNYTARIVTFLG